MIDMKISRQSFWIYVAVYFAIKIAISYYLMENLNTTLSSVSKFETPLVVAFSFVVGARFYDAGFNRWAGMAATLFFTLFLPLAFLFSWLALFSNPDEPQLGKQEFMDLFGLVSLIPTALFIAFLIWIGTRPSKSLNSADVHNY